MSRAGSRSNRLDALLFLPDRAVSVEDAVAQELRGWLWVDCTIGEVQPDPTAFADRIEAITGVRIFDLHLVDALNEFHPSYYDSTTDYEMVVFRRLSPGETTPLTEKFAEGPFSHLQAPELQTIVTMPITFFVFDRVLLTVRNTPSRTIDQLRSRMLGLKPRNGPDSRAVPDKHRLPASPLELMLRLINGMVDRYLELRQPLTEQLDYWQRQLLDTRRDFVGWNSLLSARNELRSLENLCEEQIDAMQELRDGVLDGPGAEDDSTLIRIHDIVEHIQRVHNHASRLQASVETAVQLHFSVISNSTNRVVQQLTIITAVFAPLTLITGIFGMNFEHMPLLHDSWGFWATMITMGAMVVGLMTYFGCKVLLRRLPGHRFRFGRRRSGP